MAEIIYPNGLVFQYNRDKAGRERYKLNEKPLTGVTTICGQQAKPYLTAWAAKEAYNHCLNLSKEEIKEVIKTKKYAHLTKSKEATDIGTEAHDIVEKFITHYINTKEYKIDFASNLQQAKISADRFISWAIENKVEFLETEQSVFNGDYFYAGSFDFICRINGNIYLGDFKTSKSISNEYLAQTVAYIKAYNYIERLKGLPETNFAGTIIVKSTKIEEDVTFLETNDYGKRKLVTTPAFEVCLSTNISADWSYFLALLTGYRYNNNKMILDFESKPEAPVYFEEENN